MLDSHMNHVHILCMTELGNYLKKTQITQADFGRQIGLTQSAISRLVAGDALPSIKTAVDIERETGGEVPASSWIKQAEAAE